MKWLFNQCGRCHRDICLLAAGVLSGPEKTAIENHLNECANCRKYYAEMKPLAARLTTWEKHFATLEPTADVRTRWTKAIQGADKSSSDRSRPPGSFIWTIWHELIWPSRHIWAGLATVWVLLLAANVSMRDSSQITVAKTLPIPEIILSFQQQEKILAELIGPNEPQAAVPPKAFSPLPSSERRFEIMAT